MSSDNLPSVDFTKICTFVNARNIKLWKQQAIAKYSKVKYEKLHKEIEMVDNKISTCEEGIITAEKEIPIIKAQNERMAKSVTLTYEVMDHLIHRKIDVENEIAEVKRKYGGMIEKYTELYESEKKSLVENNPLYKEMNEQMIAVKKIKIQKMSLLQSIEEKKRMIKLKAELNEKILHTNVIDFVKAVKYAQELNAVKKELAEKRISAQNLLKIYEETRKEDIRSKYVRESKGLPKLSLQSKPAPEFPKFNISTVFSTISPTKCNTAPAIDEVNVLEKFRQRSDERIQRMIQQKKTTLPLSKRLGQVKSMQATSEVNYENRVDTIAATENNFNKENVNPPPSIKLLQNVKLTLDNISKNGDKRKPNGANSVTKKKKKVSFGECLSQEVSNEKPIRNPEHTTETSPFFSNLATQGEEFDNFEDSANTTLLQRSLAQESAPDFAMTDLFTSKELDDDPFMSLRSTDNDSFQWTPSTSQQKFNMF